MLWKKALLDLVQPKKAVRAEGDQERELPQRWRDPPPRPEKPHLFPIRHA